MFIFPTPTTFIHMYDILIYLQRDVVVSHWLIVNFLLSNDFVVFSIYCISAIDVDMF